MQDVHYNGGGAATGGGGGGGRLFGGGDRRLRPYNQHQALKCPRCDSLNTKFCYYNNYNLSQPRHFCKNCRRYWTKGGVLRNVPVGGGCRKAKRSKQKNSASSSGDTAAGDHRSTVQSPSSESSSLTATTPTAAMAEERSAPSTATATYTFSNARIFGGNTSFDDQPIPNQATDGQIFTGESFTSLITSSTDMVGFGLPGIQTASYEREAPPVNRVPPSDNLAPVISDQAAEEFKMQELNEAGLAAALDWGGEAGEDGGGDQGLFDLTAAVDPAYWTHSQWTDSENPSLTFLL